MFKILTIKAMPDKKTVHPANGYITYWPFKLARKESIIKSAVLPINGDKRFIR